MHKTFETMVFWNLTKWGGVKNEISKYTAQRIKIFKSAQGVWPCGNTMQTKNRKKVFWRFCQKVVMLKLKYLNIQVLMEIFFYGPRLLALRKYNAKKKFWKKRFLMILTKSGGAKTEKSKYTGHKGNFFFVVQGC